jgi:hypothetical protein
MDALKKHAASLEQEIFKIGKIFDIRFVFKTKNDLNLYDL